MSGRLMHVETEWNAEFERDVPVRIVCDSCGAARALSTPTAVLVAYDQSGVPDQDSESLWIRQHTVLRWDAAAGPEIAPLKPARTRSVPKIKKSTTPNPQGETSVSQTETECNTVAQLDPVEELDPVEARVLRLRNLNEHMITRYLELAVALHEEHESQLWAKATPTGGGHYIDEEEFWEEAIGIKRRTAYQLIAVGGVLAQVLEKEEATEALTPVGLHKLDVITPVLKKDPTLPVVIKWSDLAKGHSREALRELVAKALGRKLRDPADPGEKFRTYIIGKMPDQEARELAIAFFEAGAEPAGSTNAIAIMIAGFQECLGTWIAHEKAPAA